MNSNLVEPVPDDCPRPHSILVVEDEFLVRLLICDELRLHEYDVIEAIDAGEAMAVLKTGIRIDLVLTDVRMPGDIDGLGLLAFVRSNYPLIPVIVTSGHLLPEDALKDGATQFLPKPYSFPRAIGLIEEVLKKQP